MSSGLLHIGFSQRSMLAPFVHSHTANRVFTGIIAEGVSRIELVSSKALVEVVRLVKETGRKHQRGGRLIARCFARPLPVPSQRTFTDESQARVH